MPCYSPLEGYKSPSGGITFRRRESTGELCQVPCGQCIGCRLDKSRQWAIRCVHEAQMHDDNSFITLTYNNENLPEDLSLQLDHFPLFMKRLRRHYEPKKIRFYHCGEYGTDRDSHGQPLPHPFIEGRDALGRPHYHALIFGLDFTDKTPFSERDGIITFTSDTLSKLWGKGFVTVGEVTLQSASYVARYVMKKINGDLALNYYKKINKQGEILTVLPERTTMSRRPGIGFPFWEKFAEDFILDDTVVIRTTNGSKTYKTPTYYLNLLEKDLPHLWADLKHERLTNYEKHYAFDNTPERLLVKQACTQARIKNLKRPLQ